MIRARGLGKVYRSYASPWHRLVEAVAGARRHRSFVALQDVDFELAEGEALGLIGENGAGKSTLLKIAAGITPPTTGTLEVTGRVASILELNSGFHPELTGRQNVALNATLLGLGPEELRAREPHILAFSELGDFLDRPVKTYSTGMAMRLGFSIAAHVEPQVLIIDEALSVGDGYFQKKCLDHLRSYLERGGTLLFCSHAMYYVSSFCTQALWLRGGRPEALGPVGPVVRSYESFLDARNRAAGSGDEAGDEPAEAAGPARIRTVRLGGAAAGATPVLHCGDPLEVEVEWDADDPTLAFHLGIGISRNDDLQVATFATHFDRREPFSGERSYRLALEIPELPLVKGEFGFYVFLLDEAGLHIYDRQVVPSAFRVDGTQYRFGLLDLPHEWRERAEPAARAS